MTSAAVTMDTWGCIEIPAPILRELGLTPETPLVAYVEDGRVVVESREFLVRRIRQAAEPRGRGDGGSVVDELIAERRDEAAHEQA